MMSMCHTPRNSEIAIATVTGEHRRCVEWTRGGTNELDVDEWEENAITEGSPEAGDSHGTRPRAPSGE